MTMRMLEAGGLPILVDSRRAADVSNPNGYYELERVKGLDKPGGQSWLAEARGRAVKVISFLLTYLPEEYDYQVIFMRRDLDEIVASQNKMLETRGEAKGVADERLKQLYAEHLQQVDRFLSRRPCFASLDVEYARVLAAPSDEAARVNTFLGGSLDTARMAAVADPALYRNRRH